jgi:hypothetical protein
MTFLMLKSIVCAQNNEIYCKRFLIVKGVAMNHETNNRENGYGTKYSLKDFLPLIIIFASILALTALKQMLFGWSVEGAMLDFMGIFFVVFGTFKLINLTDFAHAYAEYDIIAKRFMFYGYVYPFIELALGIMYLTRFQVTIANWVTLVLMVIGSIGVAYELSQKRDIVCACLGVVFKIPMTYVTLAEDIIMGLMAAYMLFSW